MPNDPIDLVFVHGWSVHHTNTYGRLPERLVKDAASRDLQLNARHIFLGRYVSFHDEVRVADLAKALEAAIADEGLGEAGKRFFCITHSTGGPVVREWYDRYHSGRAGCPMSHLVMLAPANFGSALAVLGKGRLGRIKAWGTGVEPGQGVLDWLCLGSEEAWELNQGWIESGAREIGPNRIFPFVVTGGRIDRKLYDQLNTYTGELGSDGVVRIAAANLSVSQVTMRQVNDADAEGFDRLELASDVARGPDVPLRVVKDTAHSGTTMGIMRSVKLNNRRADETVDAILRCLEVESKAAYRGVFRDFARETADVQWEQYREVEDRVLRDRVFFHDRCAQMIFRVRDEEGHPVRDYDLLFTAGPESNANHLPEKFFRDKQVNPKVPGTITYFVSYDRLIGGAHAPGGTPEGKPVNEIGLEIHPRPTDGFVHYRKCRAVASKSLLEQMLRPNETTMIDIVLSRIVHEGTFRLDRTTQSRSFKKVKPGNPIG